jgi:carnitine-CoA ligase
MSLPMSVPASAQGHDPIGSPPLAGLFAPSERTLPKMLARQAERYAGRRLVRIGGRALTYTDTLAAAAGYAGALAGAGVKAGDRVAIMCGNRPEMLLAFLGCAWLGAIAVPINTASRGAQLTHILGNCGARLLVIERELMPVLAALDRSGIAVEALWLVGRGEADDLPRFKSAPFPEPGMRVPPHPVEPGDTLAILYTSGTTASRRASAARTPNTSGGASTRRGFSASARTTCC